MQGLPFALLALPGMGYLLLAALMLGVLVFLHELGHFLVARWMGMPVETFSLGFGTRLVGFKWKETDVRLSALPLGGYVKLAGFNPEEPGAEDPHGFLQQPTWKRILFYSGGVLANLATAFLLLAALGADGSRITKVEPKPGAVMRVMDLVPGYPAEQAGLKPGDELAAIDALRFPATPWDQAVGYIQAHPGQALHLEVLRDGQPLAFQVTPKDEGGKGKIGLQPEPGERLIERRSLRPGDVLNGMKFSAVTLAGMSGQVFGFLGRLVTFRASSAQVSGPIGIVRQSAQAARAGWELFTLLMAGLSLQLAILNILPIPMLDGGHVIVLVLEKIRRRDFSLEFKEKLFTGGFLLLASLMALVIFLDVMKLRR